MITVIAWAAIICYTQTIASCFVMQSLPEAKACDEVIADVKKKHPAARLEQCTPYRVLVVSQTGVLPGAAK